MHAAGVGPGTRCRPAITFAATANAAVFLGATPCSSMSTQAALRSGVEPRITPRTKASRVDYAGRRDYDPLHAIVPARSDSA
jgi:dTDP-4-amino-4,6-dideoxygalactose transaminase